MGKTYEPGDRVVLIDENHGEARHNDMLKNGMTGIVIADDGFLVSVEWDDYVKGHTGFDGSGQDGYCWNVEQDLLELYNTFDIEDDAFFAMLEGTEAV